MLSTSEVTFGTKGGGGGLSSPFTSDNIYNTDVFSIFGTSSECSIGHVATGAGATMDGLWVGVPDSSPALYFGQEGDKGFDFIGIDAGAMLVGPTIFLFSSTQALNEHGRFSVAASGRRFQIEASNGNHLDGTTTTDDGVEIRIITGSGGTNGAGGNGGTYTAIAGDGGGTTGTGGQVNFTSGQNAAGTAWGQISFAQKSNNRILINTDGTTTFFMPDNEGTAYTLEDDNGDDYINIATTNSSEKVSFGNATTNPDYDFLGTGTITLADQIDIALNATTGTKIGTATSQKLGFWNVTPVIQPATTGTTTGFTAGSGTSANDDSTFTGNTGAAAYTIGDIVLALKQSGIIAA